MQCDRQLPACKNCRLADVDCTFWDDSLGEEIPCRSVHLMPELRIHQCLDGASYLHSLQQKVESLEREIAQATDQERLSSAATPYENNATTLAPQSYHLRVADNDGLFSPSQTAYLGPGASANLIQSFLTRTAKWHISNNIQIPSCLLPDHRSPLSELQESRTASSFPMNTDPKKVELHSLVPPSTQRAMIEHYLKVVAPEFTLLPTAHESTLLIHENPLKWIGSNKGDPAASALIIVFAISAALITRDLDFNLAIVSLRGRDDVLKLALGDGTSQGQPSATRWKCTALCALALCELICPVSGQIWDLLGRAAATMEDLQEGYKFDRRALDSDLRRLDRTMLKLER